MYSHYLVVSFLSVLCTTTLYIQPMVDINSPEVQDLIHSAVYGIGIHALESDDFQSLPVSLRMEVIHEIEDLLHFEYGEAELVEISIDQLDPYGVEPFGRAANGVCPEHSESNPFGV